LTAQFIFVKNLPGLLLSQPENVFIYEQADDTLDAKVGKQFND
jgi:hypothetical protein